MAGEIADIQNGESMASVRAKLNQAIAAANRAQGPVNAFADLPADPVPFEARYVYSLGYPIYYDDNQSAWVNAFGAPVTAADE